MTKQELVDKLVELYTDSQIPVTAAGGIFAFTYGEHVVDVYKPTELMTAAHEKDSRIKIRYEAELGSALNMYRYFKAHPEKFVCETGSSKGKLIGGGKIPCQRITYGAPGTGKSWKIDELLKDCPKNVVRTTFHPDSDYATFVGAYKPTVEILPRMALVGTTMQKVTFGSGFTDEEKAKLGAEKKIVYKFVPQAFAKAYVRAWEKKAEAETAGGGEAEKIYLVIEEINRGNCAQVFGDIFQLLDRPNGYSQYPILADDDLATWLGDKEQFGETGLQIVKPSDCPLADDDWADVAKGVKLALPPNLFIWATMNTSDQSLFPMDSAFKRRWDWKYVPIVEGRDKDTQKPLGWTIEVKADGEGKTRDWWDFIRRINIIIEGVTQSEDKKLGYFFAKPKDGGTVIDENTFVSKVVFYLWSEVLKDCPADDENVAVLQLDFADGKRLPKFVDFFDVEKNGEIDSNRVRDFLDAVAKVPLPKTAADTSADGDGAHIPSAGEAN